MCVVYRSVVTWVCVVWLVFGVRYKADVTFVWMDLMEMWMWGEWHWGQDAIWVRKYVQSMYLRAWVRVWEREAGYSSTYLPQC